MRMEVVTTLPLDTYLDQANIVRAWKFASNT